MHVQCACMCVRVCVCACVRVCVCGVTVIQPMRESSRFIDEIITKISAKAQAEFNTVALSGWLGFWLGNIAALVLCGVTFIAVAQVKKDRWTDDE